MTPAVGQLIAYDGFEDAIYSDGGPTLDGTPLQLTGPLEDFGNPVVSPGWTGELDELAEPSQSQKWTTNGTNNFLYDLVSLQSSAVGYDDASTGKVQFLAYDNPGATNFRSIRRVMDAYEPADTYYMSFLVNTGSVPTAQLGQRGQAMVGFTNNAVTETAFNNQVGAGNIFGLMVGFDGRATDERISDLVFRSRKEVEGGAFQFTNSILLAGEVANPEAPANQWVSTVENLTHHVLLKLEVNDDEEMDLVTYWVNPTNISSEAMATASAQATGSIETFSMDLNSRMTRIHVAVNRYEDRSFFFDEPRLGFDFFSVVGVEPPPEGIVGDFTDNGAVDAADYAVWRDNLGGTATLPNDASPGTVDATDYDDWQANFGLMSGSGAAVAVPEPAMWGQVMLIAAGWLAYRRRGQSAHRI
ncbi:MAG: hypothetical protein WD851_08230 [Pirellulales bacterium]